MYFSILFYMFSLIVVKCFYVRNVRVLHTNICSYDFQPIIPLVRILAEKCHIFSRLIPWTDIERRRHYWLLEAGKVGSAGGIVRALQTYSYQPGLQILHHLVLGYRELCIRKFYIMLIILRLASILLAKYTTFHPDFINIGVSMIQYTETVIGGTFLSFGSPF